MGLIRRPCIRCGAPTDRSYCPQHELDAEAERDVQEWWREAYRSPEYHEARKVVLEAARGRCVRQVDGLRCTAPARETNHIVPLSTARSMDEALVLCAPANLEAVCRNHNPRGGWNRLAPSRSEL